MLSAVGSEVADAQSAATVIQHALIGFKPLFGIFKRLNVLFIYSLARTLLF